MELHATDALPTIMTIPTANIALQTRLATAEVLATIWVAALVTPLCMMVLTASFVRSTDFPIPPADTVLPQKLAVAKDFATAMVHVTASLVSLGPIVQPVVPAAGITLLASIAPSTKHATIMEFATPLVTAFAMDPTQAITAILVA